MGDLISYHFYGKINPNYKSARIGMLVPSPLAPDMSLSPFDDDADDTKDRVPHYFTILTEKGLRTFDFWSGQDTVRKISCK